MPHPIRPLLATLAVLAGLLSAPGAARAAQSYDACEGRFIESLPATINTQGVWCLRKDLATGITSGAAITIATNNVTIDCNDFKIGGLAAGAGSQTRGIYAENRFNATIRHCNIRGFHAGIYIFGTNPAKTAGHVIENNRIENNLYYGAHIEGDGSVVEHNSFIDTGGSSVNKGAAVALSTMYDVDVIDNLVSNVAALDSGGLASAYGMQVMSGSGSVVGNRVRGLAVLGAGNATALLVYNTASERTNVHGNDFVGPGLGVGVYCYSAMAVTHGNTLGGFAVPLSTCTDRGNHVGP